MRRRILLVSALAATAALVSTAAVLSTRSSVPQSDLPPPPTSASSSTVDEAAVTRSISATSVPVSCGRFAFDKPSPAQLRASQRKAFAFYFPPFPVSVANKPPARDYYSQWLFTGDATGSYDLRDRPLPRQVRKAANWKQLDFETEIRQSIAIGLDGFIWELHTSRSDQRWNQLPAMLAAVQAVDPGFRIMLSPDLTKGADSVPDGIVSDVLKVSDEPALYRVAGAIVLAPFYPERKPASWWDGVRDTLASRGVQTVLMPLFLDGSPSSRGEQWKGSVIGYSRWGASWASAAKSTPSLVAQAHAQGRKYLAPIIFEDTRPYSGQFWESGNSATLRATLQQAIDGGADWVYLRTWNDYTESWMAPSQRRGESVGDVAAYYLTWFKTGRRPVLARDALYYFHRSHHTNLPYDTSRQRKPMSLVQGDSLSNLVELLAFVSAPGTLVITQGAQVDERDVAEAGVVSFKVPLRAGTTAVFELRRGDDAVLSFTSQTAIRTSISLQDWTYHGGGGTGCA